MYCVHIHSTIDGYNFCGAPSPQTKQEGRQLFLLVPTLYSPVKLVDLIKLYCDFEKSNGHVLKGQAPLVKK